MYFDINFNCYLWELDTGFNYDECREKLENIFEYHNISNNELFNKVLRLCNNNEPNIYLGNTINELANIYQIDHELYNYTGSKKLVRK